MQMAMSELPGKITCLRLSGRMDAAGAGQIDVPFTSRVVAAGRNALIDLAGVSFIASTGIGLLIAAARGLDRKGRKLVLFGASDLVREMLEQAAIDHIIPVVATEHAALEQLGVA